MSTLLNFVVTSFALMNPLGALPIFLGFTARESKPVQRLVALFVSLTVLGLLLMFLFIGDPLLRFFGVSIDAFRIAGGILLLVTGLKIIAGGMADSGDQLVATEAGENKLKEAETIYQKIVIPLAMPLIVGPGAIANVILFSSRAGQGHVVSGGLLVATVVLALSVLVVFLSGRWLQDILGPIGMNLLLRVMGLMVAAMGVQFMVTGVSEIIVNELAPAFR
ncbi:MarC family protein [Cyanobium sp. CH-040]|uniref:MarC family protein n=1 Tax=Cyanobium sp. CH-040 TaxID=2823708 RepID=UPI0020CD2B7F|nr:MarC family protein [Cyanobium sp. CH-040]MCP9928253.1 MarC family protein [Cyanobium sp. CH-040]